MKKQSITAEDALRLASRAEDHFFDRKAPGLGGVKLQKLVVAFANADGGELIIGIADVKEEADPAKRWRGLATIEDFNGLLQAVHTLNPPIEARYEFLKHANAYALRMFVERSADVNKTSDGKVYRRFGAQSYRLQQRKSLNSALLRVLALSKISRRTNSSRAGSQLKGTENVLERRFAVDRSAFL